jgi:hypothetical protein
MLEFHFEWEDAPTVRSRALAATWARIKIRAGDQIATRFWSEPSNSVRTGIYASALPLAQWLARNWWNLLHERAPTPVVLRGARSASSGFHRAWLDRHCLVLSREGMAYPDLSIEREDDLVSVSWVPDPEHVTTPGRFLDEGFVRLTVPHAAAAFQRVIEAVLERLGGIDDEAANDLRSDWQAIQSSERDEQQLCMRLGQFGLDPYGSDLTDSVEAVLDSTDLPEQLLSDLVPATNPARFSVDLTDLREMLSLLPDTGSTAPQAVHPEMESSPHFLPYRAGYARAEVLRKQLGIDAGGPLHDLDSAVRTAVGAMETFKAPHKPGRAVEAVVLRNGTRAVALEERSPSRQRFLMARALHHSMFVPMGPSSLRLVTRANDWQQAASRAFAAELLAPAAAISARLRDPVDRESATASLAKEFGVSEWVINHQVENHGLD